MPTPWNDATKYMRIVALSFFAYDWCITLPAEIRLYQRQKSFWKPNSACILLILVRYLGAIALIANAVAFLARFWTMTACEDYYRAMMVIQCLASWASHAVFVVRTVALCNRRIITILLIGAACVASLLELFAQLYSFRRYDVGTGGNCLIQYTEDFNISWLYYLVSTLFDVLVVLLTYRSLSLEHYSSNRKSSSFTGVLWSSSLVYFLITTVFNIANLAFYGIYNNSNATILGPMGIAITSMMSSRVILSLHDFVHRKSAISFNITNLRTVASTGEFSHSHSQSHMYNHPDILTDSKETTSDIVERPPRVMTYPSTHAHNRMA